MNKSPRSGVHKLAEQFSCRNTQISLIIKDKDRIAEPYETQNTSNQKCYKGNHESKYSVLNQSLYDWFCLAVSKNVHPDAGSWKRKHLNLWDSLVVTASRLGMDGLIVGKMLQCLANESEWRVWWCIRRNGWLMEEGTTRYCARLQCLRHAEPWRDWMLSVRSSQQGIQPENESMQRWEAIQAKGNCHFDCECSWWEWSNAYLHLEVR